MKGGGVGLVEGGKDRFVDFEREVLKDVELGRQISRPKHMSGQMEERAIKWREKETKYISFVVKESYCRHFA